MIIKPVNQVFRVSRGNVLHRHIIKINIYARIQWSKLLNARLKIAQHANHCCDSQINYTKIVIIAFKQQCQNNLTLVETVSIFIFSAFSMHVLSILVELFGELNWLNFAFCWKV